MKQKLYSFMGRPIVVFAFMIITLAVALAATSPVAQYPKVPGFDGWAKWSVNSAVDDTFFCDFTGTNALDSITVALYNDLANGDSGSVVVDLLQSLDGTNYTVTVTGVSFLMDTTVGLSQSRATTDPKITTAQMGANRYPPMPYNRLRVRHIAPTNSQNTTDLYLLIPKR